MVKIPKHYIEVEWEKCPSCRGTGRHVDDLQLCKQCFGSGEIVKNNKDSMETVICDLDNTISDTRWRLYMIKAEGMGFKIFESCCTADKPIKRTIKIINALALTHEIVFVTGRSEDNRRNTEHWLKKYNLYNYKLLMRPNGDTRASYIVKNALYNKYLTKNNNVVMAIDDHPKAISMWKSLGIDTLQVSIN